LVGLKGSLGSDLGKAQLGRQPGLSGARLAAFGRQLVTSGELAALTAIGRAVGSG
jgi:hypothetical protein